MEMAKDEERLLVGFEVGTGREVWIPFFHMLTAGQTQKSGKSTLLKTLAQQAIEKGYKILIFDTKYNMTELEGFGQEIPICLRETTDALTLLGLLESVFTRRLPAQYLATLSRLTERAGTFKEVLEHAEVMERKTNSPFIKDVARNIVELLTRLIAQTADKVTSPNLELKYPINRITMNKFALEAQQMIIKTAFEDALNYEKVIIILDEASKFLPQKYRSACDRAINHFVTQGAISGDYMWMGSLPGDEVIIVKIDGKIQVMSFQEMWNLPGEKRLLPYGCEGNQENILSQYVAVPGPNRRGRSGRWVQVNKVFRHPFRGQLYNITTGNANVSVSGNHQIMTASKAQLKRAEELKLDDMLATWWHHFQDENDLFVGNEDLAWLYGFFAAEGWINAGRQVLLSNNNRDLLEKSSRIILENFHLHAEILPKRKNTYSLQVTSPRLHDYFKQRFYDTSMSDKYRSNTKRVPTEILNAPALVKKAFFNGYVRGDGTFDRNYLRSVTSVSKLLILGVLYLWSSLQPDEKSRHFSLYSKIPIGKNKNTQYTLGFNKTNEERKDKRRIKQIHLSQSAGFLYDLEVETTDHTFYAGIGNIRVHNTQYLATTSKDQMKAMDVKLLGRQSHDTECEHTIDLIPRTELKITNDTVMGLKLGHFIVVADEKVKIAYVCPENADRRECQEVALGKRQPEDIHYRFAKLLTEEEVKELSKKHASDQIITIETPGPPPPPPLPPIALDIKPLPPPGVETAQKKLETNPEPEQKVKRKKPGKPMPLDDRLELIENNIEALRQRMIPIENAFTQITKLETIRLKIRVRPIWKRLNFTTQTIGGKILILAKEGYFNTEHPLREVIAEIQRHHWTVSQPQSVSNALQDLVAKQIIASRKVGKDLLYSLCPYIELQEERLRQWPEDQKPETEPKDEASGIQEEQQ
jgi:hypothetical protein